MTVPFTFGTATTSIPLSNLDSNFNTPITLGNTSIYLGNTTTTIGNLTLTNATISSGNVTITNVSVTTANVTTGNITTLTSTSITDSGLTNGRVTFAGAGGLLSDSASFTYNGTNLSVNGATITGGGAQIAGGAWSVIPYVFNSLTIDNASGAARFFATGANASTYGSYIWYGGLTTGTTNQYMTLETTGNLTLNVATGMFSAPIARIGTYTAFGTESLQVAKANGTGVVGSAYQFAINSKGANNRAEMIMTDGSQANAFISYAPSATAASDRLTFNLQGSDIVTVVGNGRVGIGTSSPSYTLDLSSTTNGIIARFKSTSTYGQVVADNTSGTGGGLFIASQNGVASSYFGVEGAVQGNTSTDTAIYNNLAGSSIKFFTNSSATSKVTIDSTGNLLVNTANLLVNTATLNNLGKISIDFDGQFNQGIVIDDTTVSSFGGLYMIFRDSTGANAGSISHVSATVVAYVTTSDYRLKEDVQPMTGALAKVAQLKPVTYKWKSDGLAGQGFIAHELAEVVPDCVIGEKDAVYPDNSINPQGVDTSFLVATLVSAIQEQQALIESLTTRLTALENK